MTEIHGLDVDIKSHSRLLMLAEWFGTYSRVIADLHAVPTAQKLQAIIER
jgi:hypothetical protein